MNKQQIGTKLTLDALDIPLSMKSFDERLIVQKAMYLATTARKASAYHFRWYLRGPYSSELARDAFTIAAELAAGLNESARWTLDKVTSSRLDRIKSLIPSGNAATRADKLELLASVHFLVDRGQVSDSDAEALTKLLASYGKNFSEIDVTEALRELRENELLGT